MMIDVRKCNAEGKYTGTLDFEFEGDASLIDIPFVSFSTPVHAVLDYEIFEDNSVEVKGELSFTLEGACSRCLKQTKEHIVSEAEALFVPKGGKTEEEDYTYRNGIVVHLPERHRRLRRIFARYGAVCAPFGAILCGGLLGARIQRRVNRKRGDIMAVPKGKQSKSRTNKRFANYKATAPTLVECPLRTASARTAVITTGRKSSRRKKPRTEQATIESGTPKRCSAFCLFSSL